MLSSLRAKLLSIKFRVIRRFVITVLAKMPRDLERAIVFGDSLNHFLMITPFRYLFKFKVPKDIEVNLYNLNFASPIISASFKDDISSLLQWQLLGIGGITYKTVLKRPSEGNLRPRIQEVSYEGEYGILNSLGLPNKGVEKFKLSIPNKNLMHFNRPIGVSIGGNSDQEYFEVFSTIDSYLDSVDFDQFFYEINISCPNTEDGKCLSDDLDSLRRLLKKFRSASSRVIFVKVSPDSSVDDIFSICDILSNIEKTVINIGNSKYIKASKVGLSQKTFSKDGGGLSGKYLYKNTLNMVQLISSKYSIPIVATGGVCSYEQVKELLDSGATLTGTATLLVTDPLLVPQINQRLSNE